jgi:hypothetical protein
MVTLPCRGFKIGGTDTHLDPRSAFILMNQAVIIKIRNAQPPLLRLSFVFMRLGTSPVPLVPNPNHVIDSYQSELCGALFNSKFAYDLLKVHEAVGSHSPEVSFLFDSISAA